MATGRRGAPSSPSQSFNSPKSAGQYETLSSRPREVLFTQLLQTCGPASPSPPPEAEATVMRPGFTSSKRPFQQLAQRLFIHTTFFLTKGWGRDVWKPPQQLHPSFLLHVFFTKHTFRSSSLRCSLSHGAESSMYTPCISLKAEPKGELHHSANRSIFNC